MNFTITLRNLKDNGEIINYIDHRLAFVFSRMSDKIEKATVTLSDINGPKGGVDKECQIVLKAMGLRKIVVSERRDSLRESIDQCFYRASECLNRKLKRKQLLLKKRQPKATLQSVLSAF